MVRNFIFSSLFVALHICLVVPTAQGQEYKPKWDGFGDYQTPEWYQDAKFGIWPHWGLYSVPATKGKGSFPGEWYGRGMHGVRKGPEVRPKKNDNSIINEFWDERGINQADHHIKTYGPIEKFGYHDFADQWKAEKFDADEWAQMATDSGARFFCMMAQHHDSFSLYDSDLTRYDSVEMGPKRDLCREMKEAVTKRGLKFGVSNHMAWNPVFFTHYHSNYKHLSDYGEHSDLYSKGKVDQEFVDRWWDRTMQRRKRSAWQFDEGYRTWPNGKHPVQRLANRHFHQRALVGLRRGRQVP